MTCQICNAPGRVTEHQRVVDWIEAQPTSFCYMGARDYYEAARNARAQAMAWGGIWATSPHCTMCVPEPVRQPSPARRAPSPPPPMRGSRPGTEDIQESARRISEQTQAQQADTTETLTDKLKRTLNLAGDALHGASEKLGSVVDAGKQALQERIDAQVQAAQELAHNIAETGRDVAHSMHTAGEDIAFAYEQESRIRQMCRDQTYDAGARCASDLQDAVVNAGVDDAINAAADVLIAGATRSVKNFVKAESIRGAAAILKRPNCREFMRGSLSNACVDRVLPRGYVNVSTETPRRTDPTGSGLR